MDSADTRPRHRSESPSELHTRSFLHGPFLHFFSSLAAVLGKDPWLNADSPSPSF